MLDWVLRRGAETGRGVRDGDNTTQLDQPDTPAPVFAARALKSAFFGEPNKANDDATMTIENPNDTPMKPNGILLTPGTGTTRRKRVSFGRDVLERGPQAEERKDGLRSTNAARKRTKLTELMENSKRDKARASSSNAETKQPAIDPPKEQTEDDEWEEEDDEDFCTHDITIDLNEPHSRSGKYWKTNFETYHQDAKSEMEKLLKYKQLAKSYAKMKDAEAFDLQEKLKEEQAKVGDMEKKLGEMATQIAARRLKGDDGDSPELMKDLAKQTALAVQYRGQVKELEALVKDKTGDQGRHRRNAASPRANKALLETQRELRRAKAQLRDTESLQDEVKRLKSELRVAEQRSSNAAEENRRSGRGGDDSPYVKDLLAQLRDARAESRKKDDQLQQLADDYDKFRAEAAARQEDANGVLQKATNKISELKAELRTLKSTKDEYGAQPRSFHGTATTASANRRISKDDEKPDIHVDLRDLARLTNSASPPHDPPSRRHDERNPDERRAKSSLPSRTLRDKFLEDTVDAEVDPLPEPARNVLADRVNLERPKWQPYIPRSPRNRAYFMKDIGRRRGGPGETDADAESGHAAEENRIPRETRADSDQEDDMKIDLLRDRFRNLGLPDADGSTVAAANASRSTLPPERRAAALARIEKRKAERKAGAGTGRDKENVRPAANRARNW